MISSGESFPPDAPTVLHRSLMCAPSQWTRCTGYPSKHIRHKLADEVRAITTDDFSTFAGRLTALHRRIADPKTGAPYTRQHLAERIGLSIPYVSQLFTGARTNPSDAVQEEFARCFGLETVKPLQDPTVAAEAATELDLLAISQSQRLTTIMTRISNLPEDHVSALEAMINVLDRDKS